MAILTQTVLATTDHYAFLSSVVNNNVSFQGGQFGTPPYHPFREIKDITRSATADPFYAQTLEFGDITITGNFLGSSPFALFLGAIGRTKDHYNNFRITFEIPIHLSSSSIYSDINTEVQISKYNGRCNIRWELATRTYTSFVTRMIRRLFNLPLSVSVPYNYNTQLITLSCNITVTFTVDSKSIDIAATLLKIPDLGLPDTAFTMDNIFTNSYHEFSLHCESGIPIRTEDPAIFQLSNIQLKLTGIA